MAEMPKMQEHFSAGLRGTWAPARRPLSAIHGLRGTWAPARRDAQQFLRQFDRRFMREAGEDDVFEAIELVLDRGGDAWICVTEQVRPPRADRVEVAPPVVPDEPGSVAARNRN